MFGSSYQYRASKTFLNKGKEFCEKHCHYHTEEGGNCKIEQADFSSCIDYARYRLGYDKNFIHKFFVWLFN